jgi:hypothetical protein
MKKIFIAALAFSTIISCKKDYLTTAPSDEISNVVIFNNATDAKIALNGMYRLMYSHAAAIGYGSGTLHSDFGQKSYDIINDLMGNDMVVHLQGYGWFNRDYQYTERAQVTNSRRPYMIWRYYYTLINNANNLIVNVPKATGSQLDKDNLMGQAYAVRAYCYYNLVNYFQHTYKGNEEAPGVPIYTVPAIEGKARSKVKDVYKLITDDLTLAETLLTGKVQEHKSNVDVKVAQGLRARVALTMEDWSIAANYANKARAGYVPMGTTAYKNGFNSIANTEWMWGMEVTQPQATIYASFFSHIDPFVFGYAQLGGQKKITKDLFDNLNVNDIRYSVFKKPGTGTSTVPDYCSIKFKLANTSSWAGDYLMMRASEMYLIEAEALARDNKTTEAKTVLETLIKARLTTYTAPTSNPALLSEILLQRRLELWGEGFSLFDIKRLKTGLNRPTGSGNHGSPSFNPAIYTLPDQSPTFLMKIPQDEIDVNPNINDADQNP